MIGGIEENVISLGFKDPILLSNEPAVSYDLDT